MQNKDQFLWKHFKDVNELGQVRMESMKAFLNDYEKGLKEGRYIAGELPDLNIEDQKYDITLCSHFLFLYTDNLSLDFHICSSREILRISKEVRIFPVLDYNNQLSIHFEGVKAHFEKLGYKVDIQTVDYEFQKGGNKMLKISRENLSFEDNQKLVCNKLNELNIPYELKFHPPAYSIEACEELVHKLGEGVHCKNLFLCNRQETEFFLLLIRFDKKFRTAEVSKQIGKARLSFAKDTYLEKYLHVQPGSVSPMGLLFDKDHRVNLLIDKDIIEYEKIYFHPCDNTASLLLKVQDFLNTFLPYTGHVPTLVDISSNKQS